MQSNQTKLLLGLAKKIKNRRRTPEEALASLVSAKILTKNGNFTRPYTNLGRAVKAAAAAK